MNSIFSINSLSSEYDVNFSPLSRFKKSFSVILFSPEYDLHFPVLPGLKKSYSILIYVKMMSGDLIPFTVASNCNNCNLYGVVLYHLNLLSEYKSICYDDFILFRSSNNEKENEIIKYTPFYLHPKENEVFYLFVEKNKKSLLS
jgi:hypothetical protein